MNGFRIVSRWNLILRPGYRRYDFFAVDRDLRNWCQCESLLRLSCVAMVKLPLSERND
jgi:hypothetical protein